MGDGALGNNRLGGSYLLDNRDDSDERAIEREEGDVV